MALTSARQPTADIAVNSFIFSFSDCGPIGLAGRLGASAGQQDHTNIKGTQGADVQKSQFTPFSEPISPGRRFTSGEELTLRSHVTAFGQS